METGRTRGKLPWFSLSFLLLLFGSLAAFAVYQRARGLKPGELTAGDSRNGYSLDTTTLDGEEWKLSEQAGKVVLVNYFATWCGPCREEFPDLEKIARDYKDRGVEVVGVGLDRDDESPGGALGVLKQFVLQEKPGFPILLPEKGAARAEYIPYTYLIDKHGRVAYYIVGRMETDHVWELLKKLVAEK